MFTQWLLRQHMQQGRSVRELSKAAGVGEVEIQSLLTSGHVSHSVRQQLERSLGGVGLFVLSPRAL